LDFSTSRYSPAALDVKNAELDVRPSFFDRQNRVGEFAECREQPRRCDAVGFGNLAFHFLGVLGRGVEVGACAIGLTAE
jgi:hypothetical protein